MGSRRIVADVMKRELEFLEPGASARDAARRLLKLGLGALPVCEGGRLLGVVSDRDLTRHVVAEGRDPRRIRVEKVMSSSPALVQEDEELASALRSMEEKRTHRVHVVDKEGRLAGVLTLGAVARAEDVRLAGRAVRGMSRARRKPTI